VSVTLPARYSKSVTRLALGVEPLDALRGQRAGARLDVSFDGEPLPMVDVLRRQRGLPRGADVLERVPRHHSCRYVVVWRTGIGSPVDLRVDDRTRRFVPRRLSYVVPADPAVTSPRVRRPAFYPGAAYDVASGATGLRGRATWKPSGRPVRWARVEARRNGARVGVAHGDERGEFLLLLRPEASTGLTELPDPPQIEVDVTVRAAPEGPPADPGLPARDPLWDLPLEQAPLAGIDLVSPGDVPPPGHTRSLTREVTFRLGELRSDMPESEFLLT